MIQQIGYLFSLIIATLACMFFLLGMYLGLKNYSQILLGKETGLRYSILGIFGFSMAFVIFSTTKKGFSWGTLVFSCIVAFVIAFFLYIDVLIRRKTAVLLDDLKRNPSSLFKILFNRTADDDTSDENRKNKT